MIPKCPDCGIEMIKIAIQTEDMTGWMVGWLCECPHDYEDMSITIYASRDWTAVPLLNLAENAERQEEPLRDNNEMVRFMAERVRAKRREQNE